MVKANLKTAVTDASVASYIASVRDEKQKQDVAALVALMERISGVPPKMWGPSIIGFGSYVYRYDSGREGEMCRLGLSARVGKIAIYGLSASTRNLENLGKHKAGKGCLYVKSLNDVNLAVFEDVLKSAWIKLGC
ncbi:MAG: DUF1801 domain-containing protein [Alphaproteobacteria bacterium]|nr:DUF1801 domain-containing protein [Alphaproteobacteria bacterium]